MLQQECIFYINITPALTNPYNHNTANQTFLFLFKKMYFVKIIKLKTLFTKLCSSLSLYYHS